MERYVSAFNKEDGFWYVYDTEFYKFAVVKDKDLNIIEQHLSVMNSIDFARNQKDYVFA